ncbi:hypothetical protein POV27_07565 [Aureisphaera galaxeae]|uniref:hypothetical protein n=1 Tax=Aureisphaera galaxeae TaxID=1538023 RepID=UPI00234FE280|nr:hypothetical protein [Aureisphaera galaxeae]MDC8003905.1 hypothetical protein [Aureisphaera galaxeae]
MSEFDEVMSQRSDFELYEIITHKKDSYKPEALLSAQREFESRSINSETIAQFERKIKQAEELKQQKKHQKSEFIEKGMDVGKLLLPTKKDTLSRTMLSLCIFLTISFLYYVFSDFWMITYLFSDIGSWDISIVEVLLPYLLFPIGIFGLYKNQKYGWYVIVAFLTYYAFAAVYAGISSYRHSFGGEGGIFDIFPKPSIASIILRFVVLFGIVIFLNRPKTLAIFSINKGPAGLFVVIVWLVTTALWWNLM